MLERHAWVLLCMYCLYCGCILHAFAVLRIALAGQQPTCLSDSTACTACCTACCRLPTMCCTSLWLGYQTRSPDTTSKSLATLNSSFRTCTASTTHEGGRGACHGGVGGGCCTAAPPMRGTWAEPVVPVRVVECTCEEGGSTCTCNTTHEGQYNVLEACEPARSITAPAHVRGSLNAHEGGTGDDRGGSAPLPSNQGGSDCSEQVALSLLKCVSWKRGTL